MAVIIRLQNLPWSANAVDIRRFFAGLSIPEGGVHIVGGEQGDAFIGFSSDEDARLAMRLDLQQIKGISVRLFLSSKNEMQTVITAAREVTANKIPSRPMAPVSMSSNQLNRAPDNSVQQAHVMNRGGVQSDFNPPNSMNSGRQNVANNAQPRQVSNYSENYVSNSTFGNQNSNLMSDIRGQQNPSALNQKEQTMFQPPARGGSHFQPESDAPQQLNTFSHQPPTHLNQPSPFQSHTSSSHETRFTSRDSTLSPHPDMTSRSQPYHVNPKFESQQNFEPPSSYGDDRRLSGGQMFGPGTWQRGPAGGTEGVLGPKAETYQRGRPFEDMQSDTEGYQATNAYNTSDQSRTGATACDQNKTKAFTGDQRRIGVFNENDQDRMGAFSSADRNRMGAFSATNQDRIDTYNVIEQSRMGTFNVSDQNRMSSYSASDQSRMDPCNPSDPSRFGARSTVEQSRMETSDLDRTGTFSSCDQSRMGSFATKDQSRMDHFSMNDQGRMGSFSANDDRRTIAFNTEGQNRMGSLDTNDRRMGPSNMDGASRMDEIDNRFQYRGWNDDRYGTRENFDPVVETEGPKDSYRSSKNVDMRNLESDRYGMQQSSNRQFPDQNAMYASNERFDARNNFREREMYDNQFDSPPKMPYGRDGRSNFQGYDQEANWNRRSDPHWTGDNSDRKNIGPYNYPGGDVTRNEMSYEQHPPPGNINDPNFENEYWDEYDDPHNFDSNRSEEIDYSQLPPWLQDDRRPSSRPSCLLKRGSEGNRHEPRSGGFFESDTYHPRPRSGPSSRPSALLETPPFAREPRGRGIRGPLLTTPGDRDMRHGEPRHHDEPLNKRNRFDDGGRHFEIEPEFNEDQFSSMPSSRNRSLFVRLQNCEFSWSPRVFLNTFRDVRIGKPNGIRFEVDKLDRRTGYVFLKLWSVDQFDTIMKYNGMPVFDNAATLRVEPCSVEEFYSVFEPIDPRPPNVKALPMPVYYRDMCVEIVGLPSFYKKTDIVKLFSDADLDLNDVNVEVDKDGKCLGGAYIICRRKEDFQLILGKNGRLIYQEPFRILAISYCQLCTIWKEKVREGQGQTRPRENESSENRDQSGRERTRNRSPERSVRDKARGRDRDRSENEHRSRRRDDSGRKSEDHRKDGDSTRKHDSKSQKEEKSQSASQTRTSTHDSKKDTAEKALTESEQSKDAGKKTVSFRLLNLPKCSVSDIAVFLGRDKVDTKGIYLFKSEGYAIVEAFDERASYSINQKNGLKLHASVVRVQQVDTSDHRVKLQEHRKKYPEYYSQSEGSASIEKSEASASITKNDSYEPASDSAADQQDSVNQVFLTVGNLPVNATVSKIEEFFQGFKFIPGSVTLRLSAQGKPLGEALIAFGSTVEVDRVMRETNGKKMGGRYITTRFGKN